MGYTVKRGEHGGWDVVNPRGKVAVNRSDRAEAIRIAEEFHKLHGINAAVTVDMRG